MDSEIESEASDTGALGPGAPVADLSAEIGRTNDDDNGEINRDTSLEQWTDLPLSGVITCRFCTAGGPSTCFLREAQFEAHMRKEHPRHKAVWRCTTCHKIYEKLHGWQCHKPHCRNVRPQEIAEDEVQEKCQECGRTFRTLRGLAQHERHQHPKTRNRKRQEPSTSGRNGPGNRASIWSREEVELLIQLDRRFRNEKYPNVKIREYLPHKTCKQISDKRRLLPAQGRTTVANRDPSPSSDSSVYMSAEEENIENIRASLGRERWEDTFKREIRTGNLDDGHPLRAIEIEIQMLAEQRRILPLEIDMVTQRLVDSLVGHKGPRGSRAETRGRGQIGEGASNRAKRKSNRKKQYEYARAQEIYKKCPPRLVDWAIVGNKPLERGGLEPPQQEEVGPLYKDLWGVAGPHVKVKIKQRESGNSTEIGMEDIWTPITCEEIINKLGKIKSKTAAGVDGLEKIHLRKNGAVQTLHKLYNLLMMSRMYPKQWKTNRTTLIPKPGKKADEVENWRPITIGSLVARVYAAMIDKRIRGKVSQHNRQKGFTREDGCKQNIAILSTVLSKMKEEGGVITVVDISKAFDTVPHSVIGSCLKAKGVPTAVTNYIRKMYDGCKTKITCREGRTIEMDLLRGAKQGDPLSPLLFNLVIGPIIGKIDETTEGIELGNEKVSIIAFADDLVLVAKDREEAAKQNKMVNGYLKKLGMNVAASKCSAFQVVPKEKSWYMTNPHLKVGETEIPYTDPEATFTYLGITVDPWRGLSRTSTKEITDAVRNVSRLRLKPHQKINLIRTYLLPRYIHKLVANPPPLGTLQQLDHEVKQEIKKILHLHPSTTDGIIYTAKSHGGLGVQRVENIVKLAKIRSALKMKGSHDEIVKKALRGQERTIEKYAASVNLNWAEGITMEQIEEVRKGLQRKDTEKWRQLVSQGQGIREFFGDKIGNKWLYVPELLKPSRYLDALKLRTNTFGSKVALNRARKNMDVKCRRCGVQAETLGHIIGNCTHSKPKRIKRHNEIAELIKNKVSKRCAVFSEPAINVLGEMRKPDLVIKDQEQVFIVDVTVRYEDRDNLLQAYREKKRKYRETAEYLKIKLNGVRAEVLPIVVGCRGAMPEYTIKNMKTLGLGSEVCVTASLIALRSSIEMANEFIDYDTTR